jgi:hypothetical protein
MAHIKVEMAKEGEEVITLFSIKILYFAKDKYNRL